MARPSYIWRLDELEKLPTLHASADQTLALKVAADTYRVWLLRRLNGPQVRVEELVDGDWKIVDQYPAEPQRTKLWIPASM